jgi:transposase
VDVAKYAVNAVLVEGRSVGAVAASIGRSKSWVHRHVALYRAGGDEALVPKKRGPKAAPNQTAPDIEDAIVAIRKVLGETGFDAGARTIAYHLHKAGHTVPAHSTIQRVLTRRGFVTPQPQKRPRSSWIRFESALPNDTWQSGMTHWQLTTGAVEIINFIDDTRERCCAQRWCRWQPLPKSCGSSTKPLPPGDFPPRCSVTTARSTPPPIGEPFPFATSQVPTKRR